jgi:hypothetical protein
MRIIFRNQKLKVEKQCAFLNEKREELQSKEKELFEAEK